MNTKDIIDNVPKVQQGESMPLDDKTTVPDCCTKTGCTNPTVCPVKPDAEPTATSQPQDKADKTETSAPEAKDAAKPAPEAKGPTKPCC